MKSWQNNILLSKLFLAQSNEIKKKLTNKNILMKSSTFDSSFNSIQSINTNLPFLKKENKNINNQIIFAIVRASRSIRAASAARYHLRLIRKFKNLNLDSLLKTGVASLGQYKKILNSNLLLRNRKFDGSTLRSNLAVIIEKKIKTSFASEILENNNKILSYKNYNISQYLKNSIQKKLSLNKYKGCSTRVCYNKIIGYKFLAFKSSSANPYFFLNKDKIAFEYNNKLKNLANYPAADANITYFNSGEAYKLLNIFFKSMYCLISKPVLNYTNDKVIIHLFYYLNIPRKKIFRLFSIFYINSIKKKWLLTNKQININSSNPCGYNRRFLTNKIYIRMRVRKAISRLKNKLNLDLLFKLRKLSLNKVFHNKFKLICEVLSKNFNRPVELQLTRLHHPYHDSNILVNILSLNLKNKRKKANILLQKIFSKNPVKDLNDPNLIATNNIPAFLSGLNIKISGRLMGEPIIPRRTTKVYGKGASATGKVNYLDTARITQKNRKGAYTIKITSGQNFF